jgi:phage host-nuclease inhibitor protein Gam
MSKPSVFISYSHKDEIWKNRLVGHLGVLQHENILDMWDDRRIGAGEDWYQEIQKAIDAASVAILLVSADFLTSQFILGKEVPRIIERREKEGLRIFPVIVRPCAWKQVKWLAQMNLRPKDGKPISGGTDFQIDADMAAIAEEIAGIIDSKSPKKYTETSSAIAPERTLDTQLPSNSAGQNIESVSTQPDMLRIQHLADNIQKDLELLKEYEDSLRLEDDPRRRARYHKEIEQLRESASSYQREYDRLQTQLTGKPSAAMQNVSAQLRQMDKKIDALLTGQMVIQDNLIESRQDILARFNVSEQMIVNTIVGQLDKEQLSNTQAVLEIIAAKSLSDNEQQETLVAVRDALSEIRQQKQIIKNSTLTSEIEKLSDVVGNSKVDTNNKLKITIPIIPFILSYEGELALKSGMNLKSVWQRLLNKVRGKK